jgi:Holliday junction DNA helicase RuvA
MIAQMSGEVVGADTSSVVVSVGGLGLRVLCPPGVAAGLHLGQTATLFTSLVVREDALTLYGFASAAERDCFELVQTASGIGPKIAVAVVSVLGVAGLVQAVRADNLAALTKVPGIGRKGAQKMVIELKDKVLTLDVGDASVEAGAPGRIDWRAAVASGLEGLGWSAKDAARACDDVAELVDEDPSMPVGQILRAALQHLARA